MTEAEWHTSEDSQGLISHILSREEISDRRVGLFMVACCRQLKDRGEQCRHMVETVEQYQEGLLPHEEVELLWPGLRQELGMDYSLEGEILCELAHYEPWGHAGIVASKAAMMTAGEATASMSEAHSDEAFAAYDAASRVAQAEQVGLLRDIFGNPFRPVAFSPSWRTSTAVTLASEMYESRDFSAMPILADALQDAGCDNDDVLSHCRGPGPHVRGCWVVDLVLGKE